MSWTRRKARHASGEGSRRASALWVLVAFWSTLLVGGPARAHEFRPGHVEVRASEDGSWELRALPPRRRSGGAAMVELEFALHESSCRLMGGFPRARIECPEGAPLNGRLELVGLEGSLAEMVVHGPSGEAGELPGQELGPGPAPRLLSRQQTSFELGNTASDSTSLWARGVLHVLGGWDHLAFLLCLVLAAIGPAAQLGGRGLPRQTLRVLVANATAFSVAHAVAIACVALGVRTPVDAVEIGIALSVVVVAADLVRPSTMARLTAAGPSGASRSSWRSCGAFGLLHGLGFGAAWLGTEVGASSGGWATWRGLLAFNLGVEVAQVLFVLASAVALAELWRRSGRAVGRLMLPYLLGTVAVAWTLERLMGAS